MSRCIAVVQPRHQAGDFDSTPGVCATTISWSMQLDQQRHTSAALSQVQINNS